jgi:D-glycero-alpha-D-manno-heptose-7-phosphate kinase
MEAFGLNGVLFLFEDIDKRTRSGGLGGSATATTAAAILANHLTGSCMSDSQVVALSSVYENELGVSLTGTQEQWNVIKGGVADYVWFPWGRPHKGTGYGDAMVRELLPKEHYSKLLCRSALIQSGLERASVNVNKVWLKRLRTMDGFKLHKQKLALAYEYAEAIRCRDWEVVTRRIEAYRQIRTKLCPEYMNGTEWLEKIVKDNDAVLFPLGAGGGGIILVWSRYPEAITQIKNVVSQNFPGRIIEFGIRGTGHEFFNPLPYCYRY